MKLPKISLKRHPTLNETWVQNEIAQDPSILELGDLVLRDRERRQEGAGRLDLLLQDPETLKRYEVEIQLGTVDESHIIRTIEYWDNERKKYPQYEHVAVIVAEEITSRFLNVISLFNGRIPLIALKMTAYQIGNDVYLTFVKVLDEVTLGLVEDDEPIEEPADKQSWLVKSSERSLRTVDQLMTIVTQVEPNATLKYNKHYIGLSIGGSALNFIIFEPRRSSVTMSFKLAKMPEYDQLIEEAGLETLEYSPRWRRYRIRIGADVTEQQAACLLELSKRSRESYGRQE
jgi:hypothetical protein